MQAWEVGLVVGRPVRSAAWSARSCRRIGASRAYGVTAAAVAAAVGVGVGGAKFLSNYVDKKILHAAAAVAATKEADPHAADRLSEATPTRALDIARGMSG